VTFLPREDRALHPTYWAICRGVAEDPWLLALADEVPSPQLPVNVLLAAVHDLLLSGVEHPLGSRYRSVCARRGLRFEPADDVRVAAEFADLCRRHHDDLHERLTTRAVQTNEVGRSAVLRAALCSLGPSTPVGLLDAGCSAGLNLFVDAFSVDYDGLHGGPPEGRPVLTCGLKGAVPPTELASVVARVGLDLSPMDVADPADVAWLLACLWPDDLARFERLEQAIVVALARNREVVLVEGDMVDDLARVAAAVDAPRLVVLNSWSAPYLPAERRPALAGAVAAIAETRPTTWITMEFPAIARELGVLSSDDETLHRGASVVCVTEYGPAPRSRVVAETHPHGRWLDWRASG
jgi:hypothetical protein